jgi:hypothetical protein
MVRARKAIRKAGWKDKVKLFMNVHDALEFYVHRDMNPADVIRVLQPAVIFEVPGWPMMKADWHIGKRWGSVKEIELLADGQIQIEGGPLVTPGDIYLPTLGSEEEQVEEVQVSEDVPSTSGDIYLPTLQTEEAKTLVVELNHMPTEEQLGNFKKLVDKISGNTSVDIHTPEGNLIWWKTCGLTPEKHKNIISMALGGATARYREAEVNYALVADGIEF